MFVSACVLYVWVSFSPVYYESEWSKRNPAQPPTSLTVPHFYITFIFFKIYSITYCNTIEVGLVHDVQHHFPHFPVIHGEVVVGVLPLFYPEQFHHSSEGFRNDPDPIVGKAMKLAGLHTFLLKLSAVLPLVLRRGLKER